MTNHKYLENVPEDNYFRLVLGIELRSLEELEVALDSMSEKTFMHHVSHEKNDFHAWIRDVIRDEKLADELQHEKRKADYLKKVRNRINELKREVGDDIPSLTALSAEMATSNAMSHESAHAGHAHPNLKDFFVGIIIGLVIGIIIGSLLP